MNWYVIQVRSGHEKAIIEKCKKRISKELLIDCFTPEYVCQKKYLGKQMKVYINVNGSSYLKQFLPRLFLMGIFCIVLSVYAFIIPYI